MHPVKRPKASETEEDLLRQEKEFLENVKSQKIAPAAKVKACLQNEKPSTADDSDKAKESQWGRDPEDDKMDLDSPSDTNESESGSGIEFPQEAVLFQVKERAFDPTKLKDFSDVKVPSKVTRLQSSFSKAKSADQNSKTKKKSLFARSFDARLEGKTNEKERDITKVSKPSEYLSQVKERKTIGEQLHPYLAGMTEEEIVEEQRKLLERLDPKLVEFIKNRKRQHIPDSKEDTEEMQTQENNAAGGDSTVRIGKKDLPINPESVDKIPGMGKVEMTKLAWAGTVKEPSLSAAAPAENKNARFDFEGLLIPENQIGDSLSYGQALHNHGEEMDRPGYSIAELLTLARSANLQQRSIALDTLGKIYNLAHTGTYDEILDQSVFNLLDYMDFIYAVRKGLDNNDSNSINSALCCLASLLYPEQEEACLDACYLWPNTRPFPLLLTKPADAKKDEEEMKDFQFLQLDLLEFLISRSEVLTRIEYLLVSRSELFNEEGISSVLKILIRLARHSPLSVMRHERILKYIVENHISPNWIALRKLIKYLNNLEERDKNLKGIPLIHGLKLMRILIEANSVNAMKLYHNYSILPSVMSYLAYDQWREQTHVLEVENLVLESFKIWLAFLSHNIAIDEYAAFFPVIMQFLKFYAIADNLNAFDLHHSAHLFGLLTEVICFGNRTKEGQLHSHWDLVKDSISLVELHCIKVLKVLSAPHLQNVYNLDLALLSLGKGLEFLCNASRHMNPKESALRQQQSAIKAFSKSDVYLKLTSNLTSHSVMLGDLPDKSRYPSNFLSTNAIGWNGKLNPVMRSNSPFHFLVNFMCYLKTTNEADLVNCVLNPNIETYLTKLHERECNFDQCDYFIRFELGCLCEILSILPKEYVIKFPVAYKALAEVPVCLPSMFRSLLKVSLETCCNEKDVDAIYQFYSAYFLLKMESQDDNDDPSELAENKPTKVRFEDGGHPGDGKMQQSSYIGFQNWTSKLTEAHWIFHPLEDIYKRASYIPNYMEENLAILEQEIRGCLSFIQHCLRYHCDSIIQTPQDLVTVYCRICRTFMLGSPNVYIDETTGPILEDILQTLLKGKVLNAATSSIFSKHKPSNSAAVSFYDFYLQLVNEYFDNSYFNEVFAAYLLLPLRSMEDSNVKRCFWNHQHLQCVRLHQTKMCVSTQYMTSLPEKDSSMLMLFTRLIKGNIITEERNPMLYEIAIAQLRNSHEFMTDELRKDFSLLSV